jgi:hypothetical protein
MSGYVCSVIQQCYGNSRKNSKAGKAQEQGEMQECTSIDDSPYKDISDRTVEVTSYEKF